jgi:hypothetical protein
MTPKICIITPSLEAPVYENSVGSITLCWLGKQNFRGKMLVPRPKAWVSTPSVLWRMRRNPSSGTSTHSYADYGVLSSQALPESICSALQPEYQCCLPGARWGLTMAILLPFFSKSQPASDRYLSPEAVPV